MQEQATMNQREPTIQNEGTKQFITNEPAEHAGQGRASIEEERENTQELQNENQNRTAMFERAETEDFRSRWQRIQTEFIDDPRRSVERADELVAQTMKRLAQIFAQERERLEHEWDRGDNVSTEDLRLALQRYRSFFDRLLSV
ncbi:MAG TPA: hypothetical protein VFU37_14250 [Pyrinomonadaceae bacterium]|nr:hypothetical protein [Pyrinomonadaceae bacterium]